jgi:hypothetical protein
MGAIIILSSPDIPFISDSILFNNSDKDYLLKASWTEDDSVKHFFGPKDVTIRKKTNAS